MVATADCEQKSVRVVLTGTERSEVGAQSIVSFETSEEVPTVDSSQNDIPAVKTRITKEGSAALNRVSEVQIPAHWRGSDVFEALPLDEDIPDPVQVDVLTRRPRGYDDRDWRVIHRGWLKSIGSSGTGRGLRLKVADYASLVRNVPVDVTYKDDDFSYVIEDVVSHLEQYGGFPDVDVNTPLEDEQSYSLLEEAAARSPITSWSDIVEFALFDAPSKSFQTGGSGKYLSDVLDWVANETDTEWWFEPNQSGGVTLMVSPYNSYATSISTQTAGGSEIVRENTALYDIAPVNTVTVIGNKTRVETADGIKQAYVIGKATHTKLIDSAIGQKERVITESVASPQQAINSAKKHLKEYIESDNDGDMLLDGNPDIVPGTEIAAKPVCGDYVDGSVPTLLYGVRSVEHTIPATERYGTRCNTGIVVRDGDIETDGGAGDGTGTIEFGPGELFTDAVAEAEESGVDVPEVGGAP